MTRIKSETLSKRSALPSGSRVDVIDAEVPGKRPMPLLVVESGSGDEGRPVLLFLHGKGEASIWPNLVAHACDHLAPPLQAMLGHLRGVTVVAPQAPYDMTRPKCTPQDLDPKPPDNNWNWRGHVSSLCDYLRRNFSGRTIVAAGFSRGGLGVLQLMSECKGLITRWAIVDPQRAEDKTEEAKILAAAGTAPGWLRYTDDLKANVPIGQALAKVVGGHAFVGGRKHAEMAMRSFMGDPLAGATNMYQHLGVDYEPSPNAWPRHWNVSAPPPAEQGPRRRRSVARARH
jgi:pimeloyl-ACP methyl ester carboxylesterase